MLMDSSCEASKETDEVPLEYYNFLDDPRNKAGFKHVFWRLRNPDKDSEFERKLKFHQPILHTPFIGGHYAKRVIIPQLAKGGTNIRLLQGEDKVFSSAAYQCYPQDKYIVEDIKICRQLLGSDCKYTPNEVEDLHHEIYEKPTLKMFAVWSDPDKRGNGYATKILADLIGHARENGIQYLRIGADNGVPVEFRTDEQIAVKGLVRKLHAAPQVPAEHLIGNWFRIH